MVEDPGPLPGLRTYLRANLFDGDEEGTVTMPIAKLLDEVVELTLEYVNDLNDERARREQE